MNDYQETETNEKSEEAIIETDIIDRLEDEFDWNLILIVSIWLFLFATAFLIFIS